MRTTLVGLRFLALLGHIMAAALVLSNPDYNVRVCIPWHGNEDQYRAKHVELIVCLSLTLAGLVSESLSMFTGVSMLCPSQCLFSLCLHSLGSLGLLAFHLDGWPCALLWWFLSFTTVLPLACELVLLARAFLLASPDHAGGGGVYSSKR